MDITEYNSEGLYKWWLFAKPTKREFVCKKCNYETISKPNYKRHCLSKNHLNPVPVKTKKEYVRFRQT